MTPSTTGQMIDDASAEDRRGRLCVGGLMDPEEAVITRVIPPRTQACVERPVAAREDHTMTATTQTEASVTRDAAGRLIAAAHKGATEASFPAVTADGTPAEWVEHRLQPGEQPASA